MPLENGTTHAFGALLLATGADPVRLRFPARRRSHVHYLRTFADSRAIVAARPHRRETRVVIGASFIGLEVAASLRTRGLDVHVVAPERAPLERIMGPEVGHFVRAPPREPRASSSTLARRCPSRRTLGHSERRRHHRRRLRVVGVGVRPRSRSPRRRGSPSIGASSWTSTCETSAPGIFAAGDIARWPDPRTGDRIRVEHWVVAERQGQTAARNILGRRERFNAVPFFWSQHYDVRSTTSDTRSSGTRRTSMATSPRTTPLSPIRRTAARWRSRRYSVTRPALRRR